MNRDVTRTAEKDEIRGRVVVPMPVQMVNFQSLLTTAGEAFGTVQMRQSSVLPSQENPDSLDSRLLAALDLREHPRREPRNPPDEERLSHLLVGEHVVRAAARPADMRRNHRLRL